MENPPKKQENHQNKQGNPKKQGKGDQGSGPLNRDRRYYLSDTPI